MENIIKNDIRQEFKDDFLRYSMSVITDRALPDIRDGLKPVHRRVIYDMINDLKLKHNKPYTKSARITGDCIGKYHPHGDTSVYDAACRLTLDFAMRYPLIDGQGSFGSTDGDGAASSRYTEMRPKEIAELMCDGINEDAVMMVPNFDETTVEPSVLPSLFPNMICNPSSGIAVALATNTAPHNLREVCNAILEYLEKDGDMSLDRIMELIPGPDFPLPCTIVNSRDIRKAYETGRSSVSLKMRGTYEINKNTITFTSIPYGTSRDKIRGQVKKEISSFESILADFNDNSASDIRIDFELLDGVDPELALSKIFELTDLQSTFSINNTCLVNGKPKEVSMYEMIAAYVGHQHEVFTNIAQFRYQKAMDRAHILRALIDACANIESVVQIITSKTLTREQIKEELKTFLKIDDVQLKAIMDMRLSSLTRMNQNDLNNELDEKIKICEECKKIIEDKSYRVLKIKNAVSELSKKYGDERRTILQDIEIKKASKAKKVEPVIEKDVYVNVYANGMACITASASKKVGALWNIKAKNTDTLCVFLKGNNCLKLPIVKLMDKVQNIFELTKTKQDTIYTISTATSSEPVTMVTKSGMVKTSAMTEYASSRATSIGKLRDGDEIIYVYVGTNKYIKLTTTDNYCLQYEIDYTPKGKNTLGLKGINLHDGQSIALALFVSEADAQYVGKRASVGKKIKNS